MPAQRFRDGGAPTWMWAKEVLVVSPSCGECAIVRLNPATPEPKYLNVEFGLPHRVTCTHCTFVKEWTPPRTATLGNHRVPRPRRHTEPIDPWFCIPVYLALDLADGKLWAYNAAHLNRLKAYIAAGIRERATTPGCDPQSMVETLPAWMKSAKNRATLLTAIAKLELLIPAAATPAPSA